MRILVSACLMGDNCKYNGGNNLNAKLLEFVKEHEVIKVCPEVLGGLTIPRNSCEIVEGIVCDKQLNSFDKQYRLGAQKALQIALENKIDMAILQSRSPSCGVNQIYDGNFSKTLIAGSGVFAQLLKQNGIKVIDVEDL